MEYKSVSFEPAIDRAMPTEGVARDLQVVISQHAAEGWEFAGVQNHTTVVPGTNGCFGIGATSPYPKTMSVAVFKR